MGFALTLPKQTDLQDEQHQNLLLRKLFTENKNSTNFEITFLSE